MKFAADFVDGVFDGAIFERGEMFAAGASRGEFERISLHFVFHVLHGPDDGGHQVAATIAGCGGVGRLDGAGERWSAECAGRRGLRRRVARLGLQLGTSGGEADAVDRDVLELRLAEDFAELCAAAGVGGFGQNQHDTAAAGFVGCRLRLAAQHFDASGHGVV